MANKNSFSYFAKLPLHCALPSNPGDNATSERDAPRLSVVKSAVFNRSRMAVVFWNAYRPMPISAVCIFGMSDVAAAFEAQYLGDGKSEHNGHAENRNWACETDSHTSPRIFSNVVVRIQPTAVQLIQALTEQALRRFQTRERILT